ncbi:conserved hypothetical protein [Tenacibaculum sp. 190524A02b]|uniref:HTH luxR-type domain-containing protein n=1 Tax=Tenacibaculum vairaonense TaxID=3137860 RepID=A0ABM9PI42_9FLAO
MFSVVNSRVSVYSMQWLQQIQGGINQFIVSNMLGIVYGYLILLLNNFPVQETKVIINEATIKKVIVKEFYGFRETENTSSFTPIFKFLRTNNELKIEDTIRSKLLYLRGVNSYISLNKLEEAEQYYQQSFFLAEKSNDYYLKGIINLDRGVILYRYKNALLEGEKSINKAIKDLKKIKNIPKLVEAYYHLTIIASHKNDWKQTIQYAKECINIVNDEKLILYYNRLYYYIAKGNIGLGNYEEALKNLKTLDYYVIKSKGNNNNVRTIGLANEAYAVIYEAKEEYKLAIEKYKELNQNLRDLNKQNRKEIKGAYDRTLNLESQLQSEKDFIITKQRKTLGLSFLVLLLLSLLIIGLIYFLKRDKKKSKEIKKLNKSLKKYISNLKEKNEEVLASKKEVESLLNLNERALFSSVLKVSTYSDTIRKINDELEKHIDANLNSTGYLMTINKKLRTLITKDEIWEDFKIQFEKIRPDFFNKLKEIAPDLSVNDLKHCTYIVSNLKSKEVAKLINISPRSVETVRYRIKKKMGLNREDNLHEYLINIQKNKNTGKS